MQRSSAGSHKGNAQKSITSAVYHRIGILSTQIHITKNYEFTKRFYISNLTAQTKIVSSQNILQERYSRTNQRPNTKKWKSPDIPYWIRHVGGFYLYLRRHDYCGKNQLNSTEHLIIKSLYWFFTLGINKHFKELAIVIKSTLHILIN